MSVPPGVLLDDGYQELNDPDDDDSVDLWMTAFDESRCQGQVTYMIEQQLGQEHDVSRCHFTPARGLKLTDVNW